MSRTSRNIAALIGMYPPPTTGAAKNNQILLEDLIARGVPAVRLSTSGVGTAHKRGASYHIDRLICNIRVSVGLLGLIGRGGVFYIVPDAGLGMAYSFVHALLGRMLFQRMVIHHRSFRYIDRRSVFMAMIVRITRAKATHVFLSERMGQCFDDAYGRVTRMTVSNAHYVLDDIVPSRADGRDKLVIGHLSNLCRDKGFHDVVAVFERLARSDVRVELRLAGEPVSAEIQAEIDRVREAWPGQFLHAGALKGDAKRAFYLGLDVFLFPSRHAQEAQPNVIYEALAAGVPVLATPRACIPGMLGGARGRTSPSEDVFVDWCEAELKEWIADGISQPASFADELRRECVEAQHCYLELQELLASR